MDCSLREGRPSTTISRPGHTLLIFSPEPPRNPIIFLYVQSSKPRPENVARTRIIVAGLPTLDHVLKYVNSNSWIIPLDPCKGTVSVIWSDPPCKDGNARFTTVHIKALSDQAWIRFPCFYFFKLIVSICGFSAKVTCEHFFLIRSNEETHRNKHFSSQEIRGYLPQFWSD